MDEIHYIHAADLHLDTPFSGLRQAFAPWAERLRNATFSALHRLTELCLSKKPDFLVLAGDIYNHEERSIKAQLELRDMCVALGQLNIPVFMVHGNHDPLASRFTAINWPSNAIVFDSTPQVFPVGEKDSPRALIHGVSHASDRENRNLASLLHRNENCDCFQLGLLHCNVDGAVAADRYAPCALDDLRASGLDAWALGHAHARRVLNESPFIAYSGNTQGLHANETGPKGCLEVVARRSASGWRYEVTFHELGPVQWQKIAVDLENAAALDEVETHLADAMRGAVQGSPEGLILDMKLTGRTSLAQLLGQREVMEDMESRLQPFSEGETEILLRDLEVATAPLVSEEENLERDDLLGEISRLAKSILENPDKLAADVKESIAPIARACRGVLAEPGQEEQARLLTHARRLCQDMLEKR